MGENPYAAPRTHVEDAPTSFPDGDFIPEGRGTPAGNGWRWIADAWTFTGTQRGTFIGVFVLLCVVQIALSLVPIIGPIATSFLYPFLLGGFLLGCDAVRRGEPLEVGHLFAGFQRHTSKLLTLGAIWFAMGIVLALVMVLILGAAFVPMFLTGAQPDPEQLAGMGLTILLALLVVLALSVPMTMAMLFAPALIVFHDVDPITALKASFIACLKNVLPFLVWGIVMFVFSMFATIPLLLGWLLLGPVMMASLYLSYRDVFYEIGYEV